MCILLVAILIGLPGTGMTIFGHSGSNLIKRLYYFHSSGEIFFLAGIPLFSFKADLMIASII